MTGRLLLVVLAFTAAAQVPSSISLDVVVSPPTALTASDFEVVDDGQPQRIASFGYGSLPPGEPLRATVIIVDDTAPARAALDSVVANMHPGDAVAIVSTRTRLDKVPPLSTDKRLIAAEIAQTPASGECGPQDASSLLQTLATMRGAVDGLREMVGRRAIVLVTRGFSANGSREVREAYAALLPYANRSAVTIDTVNACGGENGALQEMASATAGISGSIEEALRDGAAYYLLTYEPSRHSETHAITVRVKRPRLTVRFHKSLFESAPGDLERRMSAAMASPFALPGVRVMVYSVLWDGGDSGQTVQSAVWVDSRDLISTTESNGDRKFAFDLVVETLGPSGQPIDTFRQPYTVSAPPAFYQTILSDGFTQRLHIPVKGAGTYRIRAAVHDRVSDRVGSAMAVVEAPDLTHGALALTGVAIAKVGDRSAAPGTSPRRFHPGQTVTIGYRILNGQNVRVSVALLHGGQMLAETNPTLVDGSRALQVREFQLGEDLDPGGYSLEVRALDDRGHTAQSVEFQVE